jgi:predicted Fe-Mo cluster-binding NifX family protein
MEFYTMKVAVVTDDGQTICPHFGRARQYLVATIEEGKISEQEIRPKVSHHDFLAGAQAGAGHDEGEHEHAHEHGAGHGRDAGAQGKHARMFAAIADCSVVLARGMGAGAYEGLQDAGIRPIVTTVLSIDEALSTYLAGQLEDHPEKLH